MEPSLFARAGLRAGEYADLRIEQARTLDLVWRGTELSSANAAVDEGCCARVVTTRGSSFVSSTDRDHVGALRAARAQITLIDPIGPCGLARVEPVTGSYGTEAGGAGEEMPLDAKIAQLAGFATRIMSAHPAITGALVYYRESARTVTVLTSEGGHVEYGHRDVTLQLTAHAGGSGSAVASGSVSLGGRDESVIAAEGLPGEIDEACRTAVDTLTAPACPSGPYDVICDGSLAAIWAHETIGHLAEADHQVPGVPAADGLRSGQRVGPPFLTITDGGGPHRARGHVAVDDEGVPARDVDLIREGVIGGRLHSRTTAYEFKEDTTGNARAVGFRHPPLPRLRTTWIHPGPHHLAEMIAGTGRGLLAGGFYGGQTDRRSFAFTPASCRLIEDGEVKGLVRGAVLSGDIRGTFGRIDRVGDRTWGRDTSASCGKLGQWPLPVSSYAPAIRIRGLDVRGD